MSKIILSKNFIKSVCKLALNEDLYPSGDISSNLLKDNIIKNPALTPIKGKLALEDKPGLGFDLDYEVVKDAKARHIANRAEG